MKKIFIVLCLLMPLCILAQKKYFSLQIELVKPTGKMDDKAYFNVFLKNQSDTVIFAFHEPYPQWGDEYISHKSYLLYECLKKDGSIYTGVPKIFFDPYKKVVPVYPNERVGTKQRAVGNPRINGVIPYELVNEVTMVRFRINKFSYIVGADVSAYKNGEEHFSDWFGVQNEDFSFFSTNSEYWDKGVKKTGK